MTRRLFIVFALVCALVAGPTAAIAAAASGDTAAAAIADCSANDRLTHHYSAATLTAALAKLPADVREYSDCYDVIEKQLFAQLGTSSSNGSGGGSSSGGSVLPTWLLIVIILLALGALTFGALAIRSRRAQQTDGGPGGQGAQGRGQGGQGSQGGEGGEAVRRILARQAEAVQATLARPAEPARETRALGGGQIPQKNLHNMPIEPIDADRSMVRMPHMHTLPRSAERASSGVLCMIRPRLD